SVLLHRYESRRLPNRRAWLIGNIEGAPVSARVVSPDVDQRLSLPGPGVSIPWLIRPTGAQRAVHHRAGYITDHRADLLRKARSQQQRQLATTGQPGYRDKIVLGFERASGLFQGLLKVLQRRVTDM